MSGSEELSRALERVGELVDLGLRVVDEERGARGRGDAQLLRERLRAVVPGADRDPLLVEELREVVRVDAVDLEREDAAALLRALRPVDLGAEAAEALEPVRDEALLVR